ncbi:MAG: conjugal transfer protein TrbE [Aquidulcibacter sp.]|nr:conjugal transfer protein TrbE [Aquidulcibacter sp.]
MRFLDEYRKKPISLADHLPWAALVAPGVILNKDGSFSACVRFRGPDLESSTPEELMAVRARLNNMLKRLGTGWCLHLEARRRVADPYPHSEIATPIAWLVDQERRALFDEAGNSFETDHVATLTWLPPPDEARRAQSFLFENRTTNATRDWRETLALFEREIGILVDLMVDALPEARLMSDEETLTYLHSTISIKDHSIAVPETPVFLDAQLADTALQGGIAPKLGNRHLRVVGVRSFPAKTLPGLLDALGQLPFSYRWVARWIALDKAGAETELLRLRKRWFAKRKGIGTLMREAITKEDVPLVDTDAAAKTDECDGALEALGAEVCAFGYLTLTVTVMDRLELRAIDKARAIEASLNAQGFVAATEDLNAVEAWLGSLPGEPYADVRRPMISTLNLCDLLPISAVWAGPSEDRHLAAPPLLIAETSGATPFRLSLHVGDVGHTMIVGPTGAGKSALLSFMALQWLRYPQAKVIFFDKGRSARAVTHAAGGRWHGLGPDSQFALQPLARIDETGERAWAAEWIAETVAAAGIQITPKHREEIWAALGSLAQSPKPQRTLSIFQALCQMRDVSAALEPFTLKGPHGALLDADQAPTELTCFETFETEDLMATPSAVGPVLTALFHEIERGFDGSPTLLVLDEAWLFLGETGFAAKIREWLKTLRKKNVAVVFATQSLDDIVRSPIATTLIESCPTQILLPNPRALEPASADLYRLFGLNKRQLELLAYAAPKRSYYVRQPRGRRMLDLKLSGAALAVCGASTPEDQKLIEQILASLPARSDETAFVRAFLAAKGLQGIDPLFDALSEEGRPANDQGLTISKEFAANQSGGIIHAAS